MSLTLPAAAETHRGVHPAAFFSGWGATGRILAQSHLGELLGTQALLVRGRLGDLWAAGELSESVT